MTGRIAILGAGSIGLYVGGCLAVSGRDVIFIGRDRMKKTLQENGLVLSRFDEEPKRIEPEDVTFETGPEALSWAQSILVCVKSQDTAAAAAQIVSHARPDSLIVSLQNGTLNGDILRRQCPGFSVSPGMIACNVTQKKPGWFHQGTEGGITLEDVPGALDFAAALDAAGLDTACVSDISQVQWGKLLMNLNNGLNVLSGLPLREQLQDRYYRCVLAAAIAEALSVMRLAGIRPARIGKVSPSLMAPILRLPTPIFRIVAASMLRMDAEARSSMWDDLQSGRDTEIGHLNGAVIDLAEKNGRQAPVNRLIVSLVREAFSRGSSPLLTGAELWKRVRAMAP